MPKVKYESMVDHMKGFIQGLLFILIIIVIIAFFHFIGYLDRAFAGNSYKGSEETEIELWDEEIERSEGVRDGAGTNSDNPAYEQRKKDFGSKSLNEKDREEVEKQGKSKSEDYLKK